MVIVLDSGPLGLLSHPRASSLIYRQARAWAQARAADKDRLVIPEITDYEVRRELIRAGKGPGIARLDELGSMFYFRPLSTSIMRDAAQLWATARNEGYPTAHHHALDCDVVLAAQARDLQAESPDERVVVATANVAHLERYVDAIMWTEL